MNATKKQPNSPAAKQAPAVNPAQKPVATGEKSSQYSIEWQGPLPPPGALRQFNEIIPDGADRIMKLVEGEQGHRHKIEARNSIVEAMIAIGGRVVGALLLVICVCAALWSAYMQFDWKIVLAFLGLPIVTLIGKFFSADRPK